MSWTVAEIAIAGTLVWWWAASATAQFDGRLSRWLRDRDRFGLIPSFSFFAPNPASSDCHLLHRHVLANGMAMAWTESFVWRPVWHRALWNPDRRDEKAISDATSGLLRRSGQSPSMVRLSVPYLLLLNHVSALPAPAGAVAVQFVLMGSSDDPARLPFVRMISDTHAIEDGFEVPQPAEVVDVPR